jgi:hypothetical protein
MDSDSKYSGEELPDTDKIADHLAQRLCPGMGITLKAVSFVTENGILGDRLLSWVSDGVDTVPTESGAVVDNQIGALVT